MKELLNTKYLGIWLFAEPRFSFFKVCERTFGGARILMFGIYIGKFTKADAERISILDDAIKDKEER